MSSGDGPEAEPRSYTVGRLGQLCGLSRTALLYYDSIGLLVPSGRSSSGYRLYSEADRSRLERILAFRALGLELEKIGELLDLPEAGPAGALLRRVLDINDRITELRTQQRGILDFLEANRNVHDFISSAPIVEFENTNYLGSAKKLSRLTVPNGGLLFPAYDLNHSYVDCDVFVSIAKCKDHGTTGVSTVMKNQFGLTPLLAYGNFAGKWEDNDLVAGIDRIKIIHQGIAQPAFGAPAELDPKSPRDDGYRVCRAIADLVAARPVHLAITDGVTSMSGGQTPNPSLTFVKPNWIVAGTNVVNTSAVTMAAMNYNPMGQKGEMPFTHCDNKLRLAEQLGVGTCDLSRIEVVGRSIKEVAFDFKTLREKRPAGFDGFGGFGGRRGRGGAPGGPGGAPGGPPDGMPGGRRPDGPPDGPPATPPIRREN